MQYVALIIYALIIIAISVYSAKKAKTLEDFFLGGRKVGAWMSAFAYGTTYFSAVIFIGYAGKLGWNLGLAATLIGIGNAIIGSWLAWKLLAKPTFEMTHKLNTLTMPDFFAKRFDSKPLKIIAAVIIFVFLVPYCASVYQGLSYLFETAFHIPFEYCLIGMAVLTFAYLVTGGYISTALTNFFQGIVILVGTVLIIFFVLNSPQVGGLSAGLEKLSAIDPKLLSPFSAAGPWTLISLILLTSLGTWGLPQMIHKFYAIRDLHAIKRGTTITSLFAMVVGGGAYFTGVFGRLFLSGVPIDAATGAKNFDMIMPQVLIQALPDVMLGIVLVLILSASMSTLSSLVLVSASALSMDLIKDVFAPQMSQKSAMLLMRVLCFVFTLVSLLVALDKQNAIITLMSFSWGTISGAFLAPFLYGVRWKGTTKAGAWAGILGGTAISLGLSIFVGIDTVSAGVIAMLVSLVIVPVVSLLTKKLPQAKIAEAFGEKMSA